MRAAALFVLVALLAACGGDDSRSAPEPTVVDRSRPVPEDVRAFVDRVAADSAMSFDATYHVLRKLGSEEHDVVVHAERGVRSIEVDGTDVALDDAPTLSSFGLVAEFMTTGPVRAIEAAARRADAEPARFSTQPSASGDLHCVEIPIQGVSTSTWCLTDDGIFGLVDNPAVRYELISLSPLEASG